MDLAPYYESICKQPILTAEQEADLFLELDDEGITPARKKEIKDLLIVSNLRFVFKQAKYFSKNDPEVFGELIAAGNEGLAVSLNNFDPKCGVKFLTYAGYWINQRIYHHMASMRIVSVPIWKQQLSVKIQRYKDTHEKATIQDVIAHFPDVSEKYLRELFDTSYLTYYIDDLGNDSAFEIDPIATEVETHIHNQKIHAYVNELPKDHRDVIQQVFGLSDGIEKKLAQIAENLDLPKEKVRVLKKEGLAMLKEKMKNSPHLLRD